MDQEKRRLREEKRALKRAGNKRRRYQGKRLLTEAPEEAPSFEPDFGRYRTAGLNRMDRDAKRERPATRESER